MKEKFKWINDKISKSLDMRTKIEVFNLNQVKYDKVMAKRGQKILVQDEERGDGTSNTIHIKKKLDNKWLKGLKVDDVCTIGIYNHEGSISKDDKNLIIDGAKSTIIFNRLDQKFRKEGKMILD